MKRYTPRSFARRYHRKPHIAYHAPRYAGLLNLINRYRPTAAGAEVRILDVFRSKLTEILYDELMVPIDSLGGPQDAADDQPGFGRHYPFDLRDASDRQRWPSGLPVYDLVVVAQVYDHPVAAAPRDVLTMLASFLTPGGLLVVQSPNPRALHQRFKSTTDNVGSELARGYDHRELRSAADAVGLETLEASFGRTFNYRYHGKGQRRRWLGVLANASFAVVPPAMKPGYTIVLRNPEQQQPQQQREQNES